MLLLNSCQFVIRSLTHLFQFILIVLVNYLLYLFDILRLHRVLLRVILFTRHDRHLLGGTVSCPRRPLDVRAWWVLFRTGSTSHSSFLSVLIRFLWLSSVFRLVMICKFWCLRNIRVFTLSHRISLLIAWLNLIDIIKVWIVKSCVSWRVVLLWECIVVIFLFKSWSLFLFLIIISFIIKRICFLSKGVSWLRISWCLLIIHLFGGVLWCVSSKVRLRSICLWPRSFFWHIQCNSMPLVQFSIDWVSISHKS